MQDLWGLLVLQPPSSRGGLSQGPPLTWPIVSPYLRSTWTVPTLSSHTRTPARLGGAFHPQAALWGC